MLYFREFGDPDDPEYTVKDIGKPDDQIGVMSGRIFYRPGVGNKNVEEKNNRQT